MLFSDGLIIYVWDLSFSLTSLLTERVLFIIDRYWVCLSFIHNLRGTNRCSIDTNLAVYD